MTETTTGREGEPIDERHWFAASTNPPVLMFYKLEVDGEDTVYYASETEAWEATKEWDQDEEAAQIVLTRFEWPLTSRTVPEVAQMLVSLINAAGTDDKDDKFNMVQDAEERAEAMVEDCGATVLFSVGHGPDTDVNDAPEWIRWPSDNSNDDDASQ